MARHLLTSTCVSLLVAVLLSLLSGCEPTADCFGNIDCGSGEQCRAGKCRVTCRASGECEEGEECVGIVNDQGTSWSGSPVCQEEVCGCSNDGSVCADQGNKGLSCATLTSCSPDSCSVGYRCSNVAGESACLCDQGACGPSCEANADCPTDLNCVDDRCVAQACDTDEDCSDDRFCGVTPGAGGYTRTCVSEGDGEAGDSCTSALDCKSRLCTILANGRQQCVDFCDSSRECPTDSNCSLATEFDDLGVGICLVELDVCNEDRAIAVGDGQLLCSNEEACDGDQDCLAPATCRAGLCTCAAGLCDVECELDTDCGAVGACRNGVCAMRDDCSAKKDCLESEVCVPTAGQLQAGAHCLQGGLGNIDDECEDATDCASGFCAGTCTLPCEKSSDCGEGECRLRQQDGTTFAGCGTATCGCDDDEVCGNAGVCAETTVCSAAEDCSDDEECRAGLCLSPCIEKGDCKGKGECALRPEVGGYFCVGAPPCDCSNDEVCIDDECVVAEPCTNDGDCPDGVCITNQCRATCEQNSECAEGMECQSVQVGTRWIRRCEAALCNCGEPEAWCLPNGARTSGTCYRDEDCDACGDYEGYACSVLNFDLDGVSEACGCQSYLECGILCESEGDCPTGLDCSPSGRCAADRECRYRSDCAEGECVSQVEAGNAVARCGVVSCDCADDEICGGGGICAQTNPCTSAQECVGEQECRGGLCLEPCEKNSDCAGKGQCVLVEGAGEYYCVGSECSCGEDQVCLRGECINSAPCDGDLDCNDGLCVEGQCRKSCQRTADCDDGLECSSVDVPGGRVRLCDAALCFCDDDQAWCLTNGQRTEGTCFRDDDCDACDAADGYVCGGVAPPVDDITQACSCQYSPTCGQVCSNDDDCPEDLECAAFGRCAAPGTCRYRDDCEGLEECVVAQGAPLDLGTCSALGCGCGGGDVCVLGSGGFSECARDIPCSVLDSACPAGYSCNAELEACTCSDPTVCAAECSGHEDCPQSRVCLDGRCLALACDSGADCPSDTVCGGAAGAFTCVQPGTAADGALCAGWTDCRSAYCFNGNTCASPCETTNDCSGGDTCRNFEPQNFPGELAICQATATLCSPVCDADQRCDNAPANPRCIPECRVNSDCPQERICMNGQCTTDTCTLSADCPEGSVCGGPVGARTCAQPGAGADGAFCNDWSQCQSGYCFGGTTCETPCSTTQDCPGNTSCQTYQRETYPNEYPVCRSGTSPCDPACASDQRCNTSGTPTCVP